MSGHDYLVQVLNKHQIDDENINTLRSIRASIEKMLKTYYGSKIETVVYSGSYAKHTSIDLHYDLDICVYFKYDAFSTLSDMFNDIGTFLKRTFFDFDVKQQRVSWGLNIERMSVDIVPVRSLGDGTYDAYLYSSSSKSYTKTNIVKQIDYISKSEARPIIKLMKIWRDEHNLKFKSFALELLTIQALKGYDSTDYGNQLFHVLKYVDSHVLSVSLYDPSNSANNVADSIDPLDKISLYNAAHKSISEKLWKDIIW